MVHVLPPVDRSTFASRFGSELGQNLDEGLTKGFDTAKENKQQVEQLQRENEAFKKLGFDLSGIEDPKMRQLYLSESLKGKRAETESLAKKNEGIQPLLAAKERVARMRDIGKKNNLGWGSNFYSLISPETRKDMGEYETLGNSLIQFASNIPIRNRVEFEKLAGHISDPTISDSEREGILNAMERIIEDSLNGEIPEKESNVNEPKKQKRPILSFMRE